MTKRATPLTPTRSIALSKMKSRRSISTATATASHVAGLIWSKKRFARPPLPSAHGEWSRNIRKECTFPRCDPRRRNKVDSGQWAVDSLVRCLLFTAHCSLKKGETGKPISPFLLIVSVELLDFFNAIDRQLAFGDCTTDLELGSFILLALFERGFGQSNSLRVKQSKFAVGINTNPALEAAFH